MSQVDTTFGRKVVYCGVCSLPPEYCEYGGRQAKCQAWLQAHEPSLAERLYAPEALEAATAALSLDAQKRAHKDAQKKQAKAEAAEQKQATKRAASTVTIKRVERNRKKFVTSLSGMEPFLEEEGSSASVAAELKKVSKDLGKKFATGASVTRLPGGVGEEIIVQGDVSEDLRDWIHQHYPAIPHTSIELVDDKKKKKAQT